MKIRGTDFVMFRVSNLREAARFYREVLDLPQTIYSEEGQWAEYDCGGVTLAIQGGTFPSGANAAGRIALAVEDVTAACDEARHKGARIAVEPVDYDVCQAVEVADPDGNVVILHHRADGTFGHG